MKVTEPDVHDGSLFNRPLLPINEESGFAFAGDVRALENPVLTEENTKDVYHAAVLVQA
jgi:hypothetical protein